MVHCEMITDCGLQETQGTTCIHQPCPCPYPVPSRVPVPTLYPAVSLSLPCTQPCPCPYPVPSRVPVPTLYPAVSLSLPCTQPCPCPYPVPSCVPVPTLYPAVPLCHQPSSQTHLCATSPKPTRGSTLGTGGLLLYRHTHPAA